jgi:hypothetical protein
VPGGFVVTKGQVAFSVPGKQGTYDTRVNFQTPDGKTHGFVTATPPGSNNNSKYAAGDGMKIAYYPSNPDMTGMDLTDRGNPVTGLAATLAGVIIVIIGALISVKHLRRR